MTTNKPQRIDFLEEVQKMLVTKKYKNVTIARRMGVSERWISTVRDQETGSPQYKLVVELYDILMECPDKGLKKDQPALLHAQRERIAMMDRKREAKAG